MPFVYDVYDYPDRIDDIVLAFLKIVHNAELSGRKRVSIVERRVLDTPICELVARILVDRKLIEAVTKQKDEQGNDFWLIKLFSKKDDTKLKNGSQPSFYFGKVGTHGRPVVCRYRKLFKRTDLFVIVWDGKSLLTGEEARFQRNESMLKVITYVIPTRIL